MEPFHEIDKLLQDQFADFLPEPPAGSWEAVQQQISHPATPPNASGGNSGSQLVQAIKGASVITKGAILISIPLVAGLVYLASMSAPEKQQELVQPKVEIAAKDSHTEDLVVAEVKKAEDEHQSRATSKGRKVQTVTAVPLVQPAEQTAPMPEKEVHLESTIVLPTHQQTEQQPVKETNAAAESSLPKQNIESKQGAPAVEPLQNNSVTDEPKVYNVFTPNGDGQNEEFVIEINNPVYFHLLIFDKDSKTVFESDNIGVRWKGTDYHTGMNCEVGSYLYFAEYQLQANEKPKTLKGWVRLTR